MRRMDSNDTANDQKAVRRCPGGGELPPQLRAEERHFGQDILVTRKDAAVIDEIPMAYKDIDQVMHAQRELVEVLHTLRQVVCVKG